MTPEAEDFKAESNALAAILNDAPEEVFNTITQFKSWTINDIIAHLHMWNHAAMLTLESREAFQEFFTGVGGQMLAGKSHIEIQRAWLDETQNGIRGKALLNQWCETYAITADVYHNANPNDRVAWAGPDMSVSAAIIARQMETWAHGQAIFDILGLNRNNKDRIRNICHLGVTTYSWTFRNRGQTPPLPKPYVRLTAPSGAIWEWNDVQQGNMISGSAVEFAQVVAQTRNVADTTLQTVGAAAERWMAIAQCFAGTPETPPAKGVRFQA